LYSCTGILQRSNTGGDGSEWQQDCLATLLKLLCQLGVSFAPPPEETDATEGEGQEVARKKKRLSPRAGHLADRLAVHRLSDVRNSK
jgi:hypothetical protein